MEISGSVDRSFSRMREVFADVLAAQAGTGASVAVWHGGAWVVDLWGGYADTGRSRPWRRDTLVMPYSVTKPFAAICVLTLVDRGLVELDAPMQLYWPALRAQASVRDVLSHRAGIVALDDQAPQEAFFDWDLMCSLLERQEPTWTPGAAQGESVLLYGHLLGQVVRRVDGRSIGRFLREEICVPHDLDFHIGLGNQELTRVADLTGFDRDRDALQHGGTTLYTRAIRNPPGALQAPVVNGEPWRRAEVPAVNGHGTARAVAGFYTALAHGHLLSPALLDELTRGHGLAPDQVMGDQRKWGLGVAVDPDGYGMGGLGGSFGWWSEVGQYAMAFLTGRIGDHDRGHQLESVVRTTLNLAQL